MSTALNESTHRTATSPRATAPDDGGGSVSLSWHGTRKTLTAEQFAEAADLFGTDDRQYVRWEGGKVFRNLPMQNDLATFCNTWPENIRRQQYGGKLPQKAVDA